MKIIEPISSDQDPRVIEVCYPTVIKPPGYIKPRVQIEIGCRSLKEPFTVKAVKLLSTQFPYIIILIGCSTKVIFYFNNAKA